MLLERLPESVAYVRPLARSLEQHRLRLSLTFVVLDVVAIFASFLIAGQIYLGEFPSESAWWAAMIIAPLVLVLGLNGGLYNAELSLSLQRSAYLVLYAVGLSAVIFSFITFYAKVAADFSRFEFTVGCLLSVALLIACRAIARVLVRRAYGPSLHNTLILDAGGPELRLKHAYHVKATDYQIVPDATDPVNLDRLGQLIANMDRIIISCTDEDRRLWAPLLRAAGAQGEFVSEVLRNLGALELRREETFSTVVISTKPLGIKARVVKRLMDLAFSTAALVVLAPLMILVAILIKLEDGGPVLFRQRRMGRGNRFFWIYKFRSMGCALGDANGLRSTSREDERVTRIGRFIRRTSIDELPQLFNVWRGDMSLVGPRPHALGSLAGEKLFWEIDGRYWNRHALRPGLTGLAQVKGYRGNTECEQDLTDRLQADLEYLARWSIWLDLRIILQTVRVVVHPNAY